MARSIILAVQLERQPHRDAVHRLRRAYRRLWQASPLAQPSDSQQTEARPRSAKTVQEVTP